MLPLWLGKEILMMLAELVSDIFSVSEFDSKDKIKLYAHYQIIVKVLMMKIMVFKIGEGGTCEPKEINLLPYHNFSFQFLHQCEKCNCTL
jgi:hypothetical protein